MTAGSAASTAPEARPAWSPSSWQGRQALQQPVYPDPEALRAALARLSRLPPLVTSAEVEALKSQLADAALGRRFLLQGGDCAEGLEDCDSAIIASKLKIILQMSLVLVHGSKMRVIRVGRLAGQYAKPRSADTETRGGLTLPAYRGDIVNRSGFTARDRTPDPELLLRGYERAALTLNFIRALVDSGYADLRHPEYWDLGFASRSPLAGEYQRMVETILESVRFLDTISGGDIAEIHRVDFFTSHEGLHLHYEEAQTRRVPRREGWYNLSTHFPWIGDRTRQLAGAHVEFFRGIQNPIGVKVGPSMAPAELVTLCGVLNPANEPGRLTLIHRFGCRQIDACLPPLLEAARKAGRVVLWCCDPMHGNTENTRDGLKTRSFENILRELERAFEIHEALGSTLGGVHFELTGENVTECTGGSGGLTEGDLKDGYRSQIDPRMNRDQALEMAMLIARRMARQGRRG